MLHAKPGSGRQQQGEPWPVWQRATAAHAQRAAPQATSGASQPASRLRHCGTLVTSGCLSPVMPHSVCRPRPKNLPGKEAEHTQPTVSPAFAARAGGLPTGSLTSLSRTPSASATDTSPSWPPSTRPRSSLSRYAANEGRQPGPRSPGGCRAPGAERRAGRAGLQCRAWLFLRWAHARWRACGGPPRRPQTGCRPPRPPSTCRPLTSGPWAPPLYADLNHLPAATTVCGLLHTRAALLPHRHG